MVDSTAMRVCRERQQRRGQMEWGNRDHRETRDRDRVRDRPHYTDRDMRRDRERDRDLHVRPRQRAYMDSFEDKPAVIPGSPKYISADISVLLCLLDLPKCHFIRCRLLQDLYKEKYMSLFCRAVKWNICFLLEVRSMRQHFIEEAVTPLIYAGEDMMSILSIPMTRRSAIV